jgi:hypothetical protein
MKKRQLTVQFWLEAVVETVTGGMCTTAIKVMLSHDHRGFFGAF